jgi:hypothetical protein
MKSLKNFFPLLILAMLACNALAPIASAPNPKTLNTTVVETVVGALTLTARATTLTPLFTFTPAPPTLTPTLTNTPTPIFTFTPLVPIVSVSVDTNCRNGPGKVYDYEGALLIGETAEILARNPSGDFWYVRNPDSSGSAYCWLWGKYATIAGNVAVLPIYTPPPPPTPTFTPSPTFTPKPTFTPPPAPNFNLSYSSKDTCAGWWVEFKLTNNGSVNFKSVEMTVEDLTAPTTLSNLTDGFTDINGCVSSATKDTLAVGTSAIVSAPAFAYDPTGHNVRATVTLCSNTGISGLCLTKKIQFTP